MLGLGQDILELHIFPLLDVKELTALRYTCQTLQQLVNASNVWKDVCLRQFDIRAPGTSFPPSQAGLDTDWFGIAQLRAHSRIYLSGMIEGPPSYPIVVPEPTPVELPQTLFVRDVALAGFRLFILTTDGELLSAKLVGKVDPTRKSLPVKLTVENVTSAPLVAIKACSDAILARNNQGAVYESQRPFRKWRQILPRHFRISHMCACDEFYGFASRAGPKVVIFPRYDNEKPIIIDIDNSAGHLDDPILAVSCATGFADFHYILWCRARGGVFMQAFSARSWAKIVYPQQRYAPFEAVLGTDPVRFVRLAASHDRMLALADSGQVVVVNTPPDLASSNDNIISGQVIEQLDAVDIRVAEHRSLSLVREGKVYVWGSVPMESESALGVGSIGTADPAPVDLTSEEKIGMDCWRLPVPFLNRKLPPTVRLCAGPDSLAALCLEPPKTSLLD